MHQGQREYETSLRISVQRLPVLQSSRHFRSASYRKGLCIEIREAVRASNRHAALVRLQSKLIAQLLTLTRSEILRPPEHQAKPGQPRRASLPNLLRWFTECAKPERTQSYGTYCLSGIHSPNPFITWRLADRLFTPQTQGLVSEVYGERRVLMRAHKLILCDSPYDRGAWQGHRRMAVSIVEAWTNSSCGASPPIATIRILAH